MNAKTPDYGEPWTPAFRNSARTKSGYDHSFMDSYRSRAIACVNACAGMADPAAEITAMREAIKVIRDADLALRKCLNYLIVQPIFTRNNSDIERESETMESVHLALAKLQPFTTP
jgi:hypothetical protein